MSCVSRRPRPWRTAAAGTRGSRKNLGYSLVIEATDEPDFFGFYSPELEGFSGIGHSVEDCLYKAKWGMEEHVRLLEEQGLSVPQQPAAVTVVIQDEKKAA